MSGSVRLPLGFEDPKSASRHQLTLAWLRNLDIRNLRTKVDFLPQRQ